TAPREQHAIAGLDTGRAESYGGRARPRAQLGVARAAEPIGLGARQRGRVLVTIREILEEEDERVVTAEHLLRAAHAIVDQREHVPLETRDVDVEEVVAPVELLGAPVQEHPIALVEPRPRRA